MDVLKIIFVSLLGVLACVGIVVVGCVASSKEDNTLEHPERVDLDGRE